MWFSSNKKLLDILCDSTVSINKKHSILDKKKELILKEINELDEEGLILYLFNTRLPKSLKKELCKRVDELGILRSKKAVDYFLKNVSSREELLNSDLCPNVIKKAIITELFGNDYNEIILDEKVPHVSKYLIIDFCLTSKDAIRLLSKVKDQEVKNYIIDNKIVSNDDIKDALTNLDIREETKNIIIDKKINMTNIFDLLDHFFGDVRSNILSRKSSDIDLYIEELTSETVLDFLNNHGTPSHLIERVCDNRFDIVRKAILECDEKVLGKTLRRERHPRVVEEIINKRNDSVINICKNLKPTDLISWLSRRGLPIEYKDLIIDCHKEQIDEEINKISMSRAMFFYLKANSGLPREIQRRIFEKVKDDLINEINSYDNSTFMYKIKSNDYCSFVNQLLVELKVDKSNFVELLEDVNLSSEVVNLIFEYKGYLIREKLEEIPLNGILHLGKFIVSDEIKNKMIDSNKDIVRSRLEGLDKEKLYEYLRAGYVLFSVKKVILEMFNIYDEDVQNVIEVIDESKVEMLIDNYDLIKEFIGLCGIEFSSFIQYGSGSSKHNNWINNLVNIISENKTEDFIRVKKYFFNNYYSEAREHENEVYNIASFLELLDNFSKYYDLCMYLTNSNSILSREDCLNLEFLARVELVDGVEVPKTLEELSNYRKLIYEDVLNKINSGSLELDDLKKIFNDLVFGNSDEVFNSIGGVEHLKTLKKENKGSLELGNIIDEVISYSRVIEMVNNTNNKEGLETLLRYVFSDVDKLSKIQNMFGQYEKLVSRLYEADSKYNLTCLEKVKDIEGVLDRKLMTVYGGEVYDFSDKNYCLYAHVLSERESIDSILNGRATSKSNFISVSPISYRGEKFYWDRAECIFAYDNIPKGSFICSSVYNMGTNDVVRSNSSEISGVVRFQRGILETSAVTMNNSEALLYREGLRPCGLILPGGRKPSEKEMEYHKKYNLPFIITQDVMHAIDDVKYVFSGNDINVRSTGNKAGLDEIMSVVEPNVTQVKEDDIYTGREIGLFTDSHSMYEPTLAVLEDMRRNGIDEIYSLGDNVGLGPEPDEVFDLLEEYGVISVAGNSEYYNTLGIEPFDYFYPEKEKSQNWTKGKLGLDRVKKMEVYPASIDLIVGGKKLALCHFINDVRWDFRNHSTHTYRANYGDSNASKQFLYTNSDEALEEVNAHNTDLAEDKGYVDSMERPLFDGKKVTDYDGIIQGHVHFDMKDGVEGVNIHTLRACGMGYGDDQYNSACYYVLKEKKDGGYELEKRLVKFNKNSLMSRISTSSLPEKEAVMNYVKTEQEMRGFI